jgi:hypothetical protein
MCVCVYVYVCVCGGGGLSHVRGDINSVTSLKLPIASNVDACGLQVCGQKGGGGGKSGCGWARGGGGGGEH